MNWLELLKTGLKDNLKLLDENTIFARIENKKLTANDIIQMIEKDDPLLHEWYRDLIGVAIRTVQIRNKK